MSKNQKTFIQEEEYFRWRGKEVSRTENLSDIVFAMALTLIVASTVPQSFTQLTGLWREAIAITLCFAMLLKIWWAHYVFFRRYDLEDGKIVTLNAILILQIMLFAYPLKFLASFLVDLYTNGFASGQEIASVLSAQQAPWLTIIFSIGYAAVFAVFALMYAHALSRASELGLNKAETILTKNALKTSVIRVGVAAFVILMATILPVDWQVMAAVFYLLSAIFLSVLHRKGVAKAKQVFEAEETA